MQDISRSFSSEVTGLFVLEAIHGGNSILKTRITLNLLEKSHYAKNSFTRGEAQEVQKFYDKHDFSELLDCSQESNSGGESGLGLNCWVYFFILVFYLILFCGVHITQFRGGTAFRIQ